MSGWNVFGYVLMDLATQWKWKLNKLTPWFVWFYVLIVCSLASNMPINMSIEVL